MESNKSIFGNQGTKGIIKLNNPITKKEYLDKYLRIWDDDIEGAQNMLNKFENQGLIEIIR